MAHDEGKWRFFAYLNLFMFSMLLLILADNSCSSSAGWGLVGWQIYLLIGFWFPRRSAPRRPRSLLVNRVGGHGGLRSASWHGPTRHAQHQEVFAMFAARPHEWQIAIALLILCGAIGKIAQFRSMSGLPDAMEGPTPVPR